MSNNRPIPLFTAQKTPTGQLLNYCLLSSNPYYKLIGDFTYLLGKILEHKDYAMTEWRILNLDRDLYQ